MFKNEVTAHTEELQREIDRLIAENKFIRATIENEITAHIEELMAENKQLREALEKAPTPISSWPVYADWWEQVRNKALEGEDETG